MTESLLHLEKIFSSFSFLVQAEPDFIHMAFEVRRLPAFFFIISSMYLKENKLN